MTATCRKRLEKIRHLELDLWDGILYSACKQPQINLLKIADLGLNRST